MDAASLAERAERPRDMCGMSSLSRPAVRIVAVRPLQAFARGKFPCKSWSRADAMQGEPGARAIKFLADQIIG